MTHVGLSGTSLKMMAIQRSPSSTGAPHLTGMRVNACAGCTAVHQRWALRAGVPAAELEAIGLGDLARLDDRSRAAIVYATARAEDRFRGIPDRELVALARRHLSAGELRAVEAVARLMALANLSASTLSRPSAPGFSRV